MDGSGMWRYGPRAGWAFEYLGIEDSAGIGIEDRVHWIFNAHVVSHFTWVVV